MEDNDCIDCVVEQLGGGSGGVNFIVAMKV